MGPESQESRVHRRIFIVDVPAYSGMYRRAAEVVVVGPIALSLDGTKIFGSLSTKFTLYACSFTPSRTESWKKGMF